ncbi:MAG TPA: hypothetical protein VMT88_10395 [Actinomycetes bacterium]|nr:hypothetical protein [Actinomycetes bacterium]
MTDSSQQPEPGRLSMSMLLMAVLFISGGAGVIAFAMTNHSGSDRAGAADHVMVDASSLHAFELPKEFETTKDAPGCTQAKFYRCFTTYLDGPEAAVSVTTALGATSSDSGSVHEGYLYKICGSIAGTPASARVIPWDKAAINTGLGSWRFPRNGDPKYDGSVVLVTMSAAGQSDCA